jgi:hypothetical protein
MGAVSRFVYRVLGACTVALLLTSCRNDGSQMGFGSLGTIQGADRFTEDSPSILRFFNRTLARPIALHMHPSHRRSWMNPDAKKTDLLYVSDEGSGVVDVYSYKTPNGKGLMGQLTGFEFPYGDCSDEAGNVYIDDFLASQVVEYAKGGTTPLKTLAVTGLPIGCSVDPATGNLAVSAFVEANPSTTCGGVWVFAGGSGTPTLYEDPNICEYWSPGYDNASNLSSRARAPIQAASTSSPATAAALPN